MNRRTFLKASALAPLGLGLDQAMWSRSAAAAPTAKRGKACIFLFMTGGPAQQETFDPKPDAPDGSRGEFGSIATSAPGVRICEHLPLIARQAHHCAFLRSVWHGSNTHGVGVHYNFTGLLHAPRSAGEPQLDRRDPPGIGAVVRQLRGDINGLPGAIQLPRPVGDQNNAAWAGQHAGFLGPRFDPLFLFDEKWRPGDPPPGFTAPAGVPEPRQTARLGLLNDLQSRMPAPVAAQQSYERFQRQAFDVLRSGPASKALRFDDEPPPMIERYGDNRFGRSCLMARRLVEAGVGLVTVPWMFKQSEENFDTHGKHFPKMKDKLLPPADRAFSALLEDLSQRGLLDDTLVVWTGEFGRTPTINKGGGRDHWGKVYSTVLAGAGIRGGQAYGTSDRSGAFPSDNPLHVTDFFATIYHALGYGPETHVIDSSGRPHFVVHGKPVTQLF